MEPPNFSTHIWPQFHPYRNDNVEEALSLCDMPTGKPPTNHPGTQLSGQHREADDFDFDGFNSPENRMCTADEVFFRGQILPFRHSVSLPSDFTTRTRTRTRNPVSFSRSESVSLASSSRSSESNNSPSGSEPTGRKPMTRNQFHSHPSPTPQIRTRSHRRPDPNPFQNWRFLQVGVLGPREIGLSDLKKRRDEKGQKKKKKKAKQILMFGGCECSANEVESEVLPWRIPAAVKVKGRGLKEEESGNVGGRKDSAVVVASHRTAEWLKQLSI